MKIEDMELSITHQHWLAWELSDIAKKLSSAGEGFPEDVVMIERACVICNELKILHRDKKEPPETL